MAKLQRRSNSCYILIIILLGLPWLLVLELACSFNVCLFVLSTEYLAAEDFPEHIKTLVQKEKESEEQEKRQREIERNTCKVPWSFGSVQDVFWMRIRWCFASLLKRVLLSLLSCFSPSDKAFLHAPCKDDDGEQAGSTQGQNSQRSNRDGLQGLLVYCGFTIWFSNTTAIQRNKFQQLTFESRMLEYL